MRSGRDEYDTIRLYLLDKLAGEEREEFERRLLTDDELFEELLSAEDELIDDFLTSDLSREETAQFEKHFLVTKERQQKLRLGKAFRKYSTAHPNPEPLKNDQKIDQQFTFKGTRGGWTTALVWQQLFSPQVRASALTLLILISAFAIWRIGFYRSDVDKGLLALNNAYREQRPLEARVSEFTYAPYSTTRGNNDRVNILELDHAERYLRDAVRDDPGAASYYALGKLYLAKKDFGQAIQQFEQSLKAGTNNAQIYADLGAAFLEKAKLDETGPEPGKAQEEFAQSREYLKRALELNPKLPEALFNRALVSEKQLLRQQAIEDWNEYLKVDPNSQWANDAREHLKRLEEQKTGAARANENLHADFLKAFESKSADAAWAALSNSRTREGNTIVQALIDEYLGFSARGQSHEATTTLEKLSFAGKVEQEKVGDFFISDLTQVYRDANSQTRDQLAQARSRIKAGKELYGQNQFDAASRIYAAAKDAFTQLGDEPEALLAESWIGYNYLRIPKVEESARIFTRLAIEFQRRNYKSLWSQTLPALGDVEWSRNEFSKTLEHANRGLEISHQIEDITIGVRCLGQSVSTHLSLGNYRQSLESFIQAVALADNLPYDPTLIWQLYFQAALDFHHLGFPASALAFEEEALRLAYASKAPIYISRSLERRGVLYGAQNQYEEAIKSGVLALAEGEKISNDVSRTNILAHSHLILGQLHSESGNPRTALEHFDRSIELYQKLDFNAYLYEARKGRLLALIALNGDAAADQELRTVLNLFESYRDRIVEEENSNRFFDVGHDTYDLAIDFAYSRLRDPNRAFEYAESSRSRMLYEMMKSGARLMNSYGQLDLMIDSQTKPMSLTEIQKHVPGHAQILQYSLLNDKLIAWVVTKDEIKNKSVAVNKSELDSAITDYFGLMSRSTDEKLQRSKAEYLYATLIAPFESLLDTRRQLVIAADKHLNYVSFASLVSPLSGKYLIEDYSVEMTPSASIFVLCSEQAKTKVARPDERLLVIGNPHFDRATFPDLPDLPGARREAELIRKYYPATPIVLVGNEARAGQVKNDLKNFDVIHLATHAVADARSPLLSKLLLAREPTGGGVTHHAGSGFLQASEIYGLMLPRARLVVLSACQTGIERTYKGEGAIGLARPFVAAGVPIVVASLWPVESEGTAQLMISFHKYRRVNKLPTVEALRQAQLEMIRNSKSGSKNNSWAGFVVIGGYAGF